MNRRPVSITLIGCLFLAAGIVGIAYHATDLSSQRALQNQLFWVLLVRLLAVVGGAFLLRGCNWARWLLLVWMAYHVILSALHSPLQLIVHGLLMVAIAYFLFRRQVSAYFRAPKPEAAKPCPPMSQ